MPLPLCVHLSISVLLGLEIPNIQSKEHILLEVAALGLEDLDKICKGEFSCA